MRPSWIEVDVAAIAANVAAIAATVAPARLCAVVKADAYGHGDVPVADVALANGADRLAVALVEEGARLRDAGIRAPILLLSEPILEDLDAVVELDLTPTLSRRDSCETLARSAARRRRTPYAVHVKLDTGMHRAGVAEEEALTLARIVHDDPRLTLEGVWTHFPVAEEDPAFTAGQTRALLAFRERLTRAGIAVPLLHAANTAAALGDPATRLDMVRVGLGLYGLRPAPGIAADLSLRPAMRVVSHVSHLRRLPAGARPSYGRRRPLPRPSTVATVPIGYADGMTRRLSAVGGEVLIGGRRRPLAGTVTMDQIVVDVGDDPVGLGDEVVVLGTQGEGRIDAEEWARRLDTITYEVVCRFGARLPRRHLPGTDDG